MKKSKILKNMKFKLLAVSMLLLSGVVNAGVRDGAGGDGVYVQGKLVMRDLINTDQLELVNENVSFVYQMPGFKDLMIDIASVNPKLAVEIMEDLILKAKIWTTNSTLPILPDAVTTAAGAKAEAQIAVRFEDDIIISLPAFKQVDGIYILLHEALHGIVPGSGPVHHTYVRAIVKYIFQNRGKLDQEKINLLLVRSGVSSEIIKKPKLETTLKVLLALPDNDPAKCALASIVKSDNGNNSYHLGFGSYGADLLEKLPEFSNCPKSFPMDYIREKFPVVADFLSLERNAFGSLYVNKIKPIHWYSGTYERDYFQKSCTSYASESIKNELNQRKLWIEKGLKIIQKAKEFYLPNRNISPSQDPVLSMILRADLYDGALVALPSFALIDGSEENYKTALEQINEKFAVYTHNQKVCAE